MVPSGSIDQGDRQTISDLYSGILAGQLQRWAIQPVDTTVWTVQQPDLNVISSPPVDDSPEEDPPPEDTGYTRPLPMDRPSWTNVPLLTNPVYFSPSGNDANPGTLAEPKQTFAHAMVLMKTGGHVLFERGGTWNITRQVIKGANPTEYAYMGAYGTGDKPIIISPDGILHYEGVSRHYFQNIDFRSSTYGTGIGVTVWDKVNYIVMKDCVFTDFAVGLNISEGRKVVPYNSHFALLDCEGRWNTSGFFFGGVSEHTFIDGNYAEYNGRNDSARNYYLSGEADTQTNNYVFQRNTSRHNCPLNGKQFDENGDPDYGPSSDSPCVVAHGYIDGLYFVDNDIREEKGNVTGGCWGVGIDQGRPASWGIENFPNLTCTGNIFEYTGNLAMGFTNVDGGLVGWNTITIDAALDAAGVICPAKAEDPETPTNTLTVVHNTLTIEGDVNNHSRGIVMTMTTPVLEHNLIRYQDDAVQKYIINGTELTDLGTNAIEQI